MGRGSIVVMDPSHKVSTQLVKGLYGKGRLHPRQRALGNESRLLRKSLKNVCQNHEYKTQEYNNSKNAENTRKFSRGPVLIHLLFRKLTEEEIYRVSGRRPIRVGNGAPPNLTH